MAGVSWIKIMVDVFDNRKIRQIEVMPEGDTILVIWFKLLTLAGRTNDGGMVYFMPEIPYTEEMLATAFNRPLPVVKLALKVFESFHMIEIVNDIIMLPGWEEYQNVDGMERARELARLRQQRRRAGQKLLNAANEHLSRDMSRDNTVTVTIGHAVDIDIDKEIDKDIDIKKEPPKGGKKKDEGTRFAAPSVHEVAEYISEKGYHVDAEAFCAFYDSNGWRVGRNPMKDWRRALVTWEKRREQDLPKVTVTEPRPVYRRFDDDMY